MGFDQALIRYFYRFDTADYQRTIVRECCVLPFMCTLLAGIVVNVLSWMGLVSFEFEPGIMTMLTISVFFQVLNRIDLILLRVTYLEDGRLELSNNRAERSMKPFVMGRKNWLFANTAGGARASAVIYSLIETAKENGFDPYRYLLWVLQNAPQLSETDEAWTEKLLPANAPEECYMPQK